jgi:hypothetical protein
MADDRFWPGNLLPFAVLAEAALEGRLSTDDYQTLFFVIFETGHLDERSFEILDSLFGQVDLYVDDESLRDAGDLGPAELLAQIDAHMLKLRELVESR